jgi:hypothetical protein
VVDRHETGMSFKKYEVLVAGFFNCGVLKVFLSIVVEYVFMIDEDPVVVMTWMERLLSSSYPGRLA